jgi:GT2 family glycosyltransferase
MGEATARQRTKTKAPAKKAPRAAAKAPRAATKAPRAATKAPRAATKAPRVTANAPSAAATATRTRSEATRTEPSVRRAARLASDLIILVRNGGAGDPAPRVEVARWAGEGSSGKGPRLVLASGRLVQVPASWWEEVHTDLKDLVREELAPLDAEARVEVMGTLVESAAQQELCSLELANALHGIREVLRERLPRCAVDARQPAGLSIEQILAVDDRSFWVNGWMHDGDGAGVLTLVSPESARVAVLERAFRYERPDVVQFYAAVGTERTSEHGFTAFFTLPAPSLLAGGWIAELRTSDGLDLEVLCPPVVREAQAVRATILGELSSAGAVGGALAGEHGRHALTRLQRRITEDSQVVSIEDYGTPPSAPTSSIVVPLYKRLDLIEHQLLHFSRDQELAAVELIYVLDSVEQSDELADLARELFALYGLPFRIVNLSSGAGFAGATNHGVAAAHSERLVLLNSDVIPDRPGWIGAMNDFYDATDGIGALGPKLLYEDDSLQHAGLYFHRRAGSELWENAHCFKGLHRSFGPANVARPVPAVTAACMLIDRERYEQVEGLPLHYVQGDYEDSELCLRLSQEGFQNWYLPSVELYHLEGQSYTPGLRRVPSDYNMWLHSSLWGERIEQAMADFDPHGLAPRPVQEGR